MKSFFVILGGFLLTACLLLAGFEYSATNAELYYETQLENSVDAGISPETMRELDGLLADYLSGDKYALGKTDLFSQRAVSHMSDVFDLFSALRAVIYASAAGAIVCLAAGMIPSGSRRRRLARASVIGPLILYVPLAALAVWALVDFDSAFLTMHTTLFSNDLWLLPEGDLMIRMLPEEFFVSLAGKLLLRAGLVSLAAPIALRTFAVDIGILLRREGK